MISGSLKRFCGSMKVCTNPWKKLQFWGQRTFFRCSQVHFYNHRVKCVYTFLLIKFIIEIVHGALFFNLANYWGRNFKKFFVANSTVFSLCVNTLKLECKRWGPYQRWIRKRKKNSVNQHAHIRANARLKTWFNTAPSRIDQQSFCDTILLRSIRWKPTSNMHPVNE